MSPEKCMKEENIMLSLLIPGLTQPGNNIDVYLEPLIEDLSQLWEEGEILSGHNISQILRNYKNDFRNVKVTRRKRKVNESVGSDSNTDDESSDLEEEEEVVDEEELSRWKKRPIFFKLPYWEDLPVRHNLDVMHVERNVAASLIATLLHCGKSKDGLNARKDLELLGIRKDLHPQPLGKRTYLPPAPWSLSSKEKKVFCKRLSDFRGLDGYCLNISRCVKIEESKISGLKSHDYHVLMQQVLPVAIRGVLPKGVRIAIGRLCDFFHHLCQRVIDIEKISVMETEIVETLCMFERFFPPSFFDIMVHLVVHLGRESRLCGPVHFRWMYPFERYMKVLKDFVTNLARPEGCIAEAYLAEEYVRFCSQFLKKTTGYEEKPDRNTEFESSSILEGRPISAGTCCVLSEKDKNIIPISLENHEDTQKWLAYGPRVSSRSYTGYIINGLRFHTISVDRQSQNSGVLYEATTMYRSSAKDTSQMVDLVTYYGRVVEILLIDYNTFYIPVFRCLWVNLNGESEEQACEEAKDTEEEADRCRNGGCRRAISRRCNKQRSLR
ncbi:uncharacterized protein LOC106413295 [Brassica napus]|uniref:uncharacterized protein LOC106413295 n=1 Tax=Brassica napus TaxID=3708 RepID=UPI0006AB689D|nr:uncharacterized protein LOC106413295 [Brassica napus]